jgi:hypothetical protein
MISANQIRRSDTGHPRGRFQQPRGDTDQDVPPNLRGGFRMCLSYVGTKSQGRVLYVVVATLRGGLKPLFLMKFSNCPHDRWSDSGSHSLERICVI